ncbi:MAG: tRNA-dihydrouridine synthase [Catonella sp.]|uniref:tRNA-dihydrouridine synthase n=1 Tax=Catonella sp. TaxID=2382125 RepID=UPI003F9F3477
MVDYFISFAPMEGITGRIFRKTFDRHFKGVTDYYTPFITPKEKRGLDKKDIKELMPKNNDGLKIIPQILTNSYEAFNLTAKKLMELGYEEININLGCPSGTVVNKGRGAGALKDLDSLRKLLDGIYSESEKMGLLVSIKTRIGYNEADEFAEILSVYKKFPLAKLIIHPRTRMEFYKGKVHKESFSLALQEYSEKGRIDGLCFNGELNNVSDIKDLAHEFSNLNHIMIGRGLLRNPFLAEDIIAVNNMDRSKRLRLYLDDLLFGYLEEFNGSNAAILKMKELWFYVKESFEDSEHYLKDIKKAKGVAEYRAAVNVLFSNCRIKQA